MEKQQTVGERAPKDSRWKEASAAYLNAAIAVEGIEAIEDAQQEADVYCRRNAFEDSFGDQNEENAKYEAKFLVRSVYRSHDMQLLSCCRLLFRLNHVGIPLLPLLLSLSLPLFTHIYITSDLPKIFMSSLQAVFAQIGELGLQKALLNVVSYQLNGMGVTMKELEVR